ncbi:MAG: hypothetical protein M3N30_09270, partial [Bacteroidota bacterium]|nr:hypothetical protein [Bacteroidota bacterium]
MSKRILNRIYFFLLLMLMGIAFAEAQTIHSLSVQDAIGLAKKNNIQVKTALTNLAIQEQSNKEATALALPKVTGTAGTTDYFNIP